MARRKVGVARKKVSGTKRKTTTRRRKRVSGIGSLDVGGIAMTVVGLGVGAIAARELNTILVKQFPTLTPTMVGLGQIAIGVALPMFMKSKLGTDIGNGMVAFGVQVEAVNFGLISGIGAAPNRSVSYRLSGAPLNQNVIGYTNQNVIGGANNNNRVSLPNPSKGSASTY
jgi:hypothetical protein